MGNEGKRRPAGFAIPSDVTHAELPQYLHDIFHESATPRTEMSSRFAPARMTSASSSARALAGYSRPEADIGGIDQRTHRL
ncbi:DUF7661 family protein [Variovorax sp. LT2P21]|uniref:DUF7661 family protein n=1 Tax=Variovorax sp. LT2P21 TaxID=3443731 RepID=UPI003F4841DE